MVLLHMRLSKYSPWFGYHSVVKILDSQFELDDTPNPGSKKLSWSQLSNGVSCLSWWFDIFVAKVGFVSRNGGKRQWNCIIQLQTTISPIIYDVMVESQCVLKCLGHQLYNDIGQNKSWDLVLGTKGIFVQNYLLSWISLKKSFFGHMAILVIRNCSS